MDANGTRFHLLLGEADWSKPSIDVSIDDEATPDALWDEDRGALSLARRVFLPPGGRTQTRTLDVRRGAAADRYGNVYRITDDRRGIVVKSSGSGETSLLWPLPDRAPEDEPAAGAFRDFAPPTRAHANVTLCGLAITCHHRLLAGFTDAESGETGILVLDLHSPAPAELVVWPVARIAGGGGFAPFDIAPLPDGGAWILDRDNRAVWGLDAALSAIARIQPAAAVPSPFHPATGSLAGPADKGVAPESDRIVPLRALPAGEVPVAIEAVGRGIALVISNPVAGGFAIVHVLRPLEDEAGDLALSTEVLTVELPPDAVEGFSLLAHDVAAVPPKAGTSDRLARLILAPSMGLQAYAFDLRDGGPAASPRYALTASPAYLPMHAFTGRGLVTYADRPYYDDGDLWILLTERPRRRYRRAATITARPMDGKEPGCVWHRVLLDASIPRTSAVKIASRAAETLAELASAPWNDEPRAALRRDGSEIPYAPRPLRSGESPSGETGTWDTLLQAARGRYLQLRIELSGDGTSTPLLSALRVYYPRFSYLDRYLPAIYRQDAASRSFVDRLLSLFEGFYTPIEDRIAAVQGLFDVRSAPPEALDWLASWLGVALDPAWDDRKRRVFLRHAADFFRWRGTVRGVVTALELALSPPDCADEPVFDDSVPLRQRSIRVVEKFTSRRLPGVIAGDPTEQDGLREVPGAGLWQPSQGREVLSDRYRAALESAGVAADAIPPAFPVREPADETRGIWRTFSKQVFGFPPQAKGADAPEWLAFLTKRYGTIESLNSAYPEEYGKFADVPVPALLPTNGAPLGDWYDFEGHLSIRRYAHRFVVVLPVRPGDAAGTEDYQERKRLAERITALEKPAHTTFEVRFYWAMFLAGEARLGTDTQIHRDRAPELLGPFVLDRSYVAQGYLAPRPPDDAADRTILGRDALREGARAEET